MNPKQRTKYEEFYKEAKAKIKAEQEAEIEAKLREKAEFDAKPTLEKAKILFRDFVKGLDKIGAKLKEADKRLQNNEDRRY